tara:strand:+ start:1282 stop:1782 length:501 start_codon:yes stop_codon:yes gene_type:complete
MSIGSKIRSAVNSVGKKSASVGRIGHKAGNFVGKFDSHLGKQINDLANTSEKVASVAKDVGHIGTTTGLFFNGGRVLRESAKHSLAGAIGGGAVAGPMGALGGASRMGGGFTGPIARTGLTHLATAGLGASSRLLAQPHEQLRRRDVVTEGGRLSRQARSHLKSFR